MKLKKLAIKFLTIALSLLTLFQVGCGRTPYVSYYNFFANIYCFHLFINKKYK